MIQIPEWKYANVREKHISNINKSVKDVINFYINVCDAIDSEIPLEQLSKSIELPLHKATVKSFLSQISIKPYDKLSDLQTVFVDREFEKDFLDNRPQIQSFLAEMLNPNSLIYIEHILGDKPEDLISLYHKIVKDFPGIKTDGGDSVFTKNQTNQSSTFKVLRKIFNFEGFRKGKSGWGAYQLCEELDINVCPYCNRMYTFTVGGQGGNLTRPELDHYYPISKFPIFALSFFNLIPSCKVCNSSIKKSDYLNINEYLHPYIDSLDPAYTFDFRSKDLKAMEGKNKNNEIFINRNDSTNRKSDNFLKKFSIEPIYGHHKEVVPTFIKKHKHYPDSVINELVSLLGADKQELLSALYSPPDQSSIIDSSLGKLHRDLYLQFLKYYKI
ncbi:HNH endonuclease [Shouchella shacheensis]|uniref:HNH endonuclease n=1 Tax=Shouchella shacheensis TaxID=1649580 RepID=UPI00073FAE49|nr:hypothetical protein [Shouchella shacheensis]